MRHLRRVQGRPAAWRLALMGLAGLLAAAVLAAVPANADPPPLGPPTLGPPTLPPVTPLPPPGCSLIVCGPPRAPFYFVVLGDSFSSGEGASHSSAYVGKADGSEDWRHRSGFAAPHLAWAYLEAGRYPVGEYTVFPTELRTTWGRDQLFFNASSGAETRHLNEAQMEGQNSSVQRNQPQLWDVRTDSQIVYFGLGGNDAGFGSLMGTAVQSYNLRDRTTDMWRVLQPVAVKAEVVRLLRQIPQVSANVEQGLVDTHATMPVADIVVALYPVGVKASGNADLRQITGETLNEIYPFAVAVNQAIKDAVERFRVRFPDVKVHVFDPNTAGPNGTSVVAGHELGQPDPYFNGVKFRPSVFGQFKFFKAYQESFHPNEPGNVAMGKALATWMAAQFPAIFPSGPSFSRVHADAQASADDPLADQQAEEWAMAHPEEACDETGVDSVCHFIGPGGGLSIPFDVLKNPIKLLPIPGAPTVGVDGGGTGAGGPGGGTDTSTWIPATYSSAPNINIPMGDPCFLTVWSGYQAVVTISTSTVSGGGLQPMVVTWVNVFRSQPSDPCYTDDGDNSDIEDWLDEFWGSMPSG